MTLEQTVLVKLFYIQQAKLLMLSIKFFFEYFFDEVLSPPSLCIMKHSHLAGFPLEIQMSSLLCHYNIDSIMSIMPISGPCGYNTHLPTIKMNIFYFYCQRNQQGKTTNMFLAYLAMQDHLHYSVHLITFTRKKSHPYFLNLLRQYFLSAN